MSTETIARPNLNHLGLATANVDAMIDWYGKVLGMTVNQRMEPPKPGQGPPFTLVFLSNGDTYQQITLFGMPRLAPDAEKSRHPGMQHFAWEHKSLDDLLAAYAQLKKENILPVIAMDEGVHTCLYYQDPDRNNVELNASNYTDKKSALEHLKNPPPGPHRVFVDPDKLIAAREAGASPWEIHERAFKGEFAPAEPVNPQALL